MRYKGKREQPKDRSKLLLFAVAAVLCALVAAAAVSRLRVGENVKELREKVELLAPLAREHEDVRWAFLSVSDGESQARVWSGEGEDAASAIASARARAEREMKKSGLSPRWVRADVVTETRKISSSALATSIKRVPQHFFRYGLALDENFHTALLEAELNNAEVYDYETGGIGKKELNAYLEAAGRKPVEALPGSYTIFRCAGYFCDEDNQVCALGVDDLDYGRRVQEIDGECAKELINRAADYLERQIKEDGSFVYGWYGRTGKELDSYNILRHAGTVWSLILRSRMDPERADRELIERAIDYLLSQVVYDGDRAYVLEEKNGEIKLGGCGITVLALTEYMDAFGEDRYIAPCEAMGRGILSMLNRQTGEYYHVLNSDFTPKEPFRTVYYDGEATFALCRLYNLTGEQEWLDAARCAADHFISADYVQYKDHWVAYSMNEITRFLPDEEEYYAFALRNYTENREKIESLATASPINLELLMATFEVSRRAEEHGFPAEAEDLGRLIELRCQRELDSFYFPEVAMYSRQPQKILDSFMVRNEKFRVRIDDVQHTIGGYYFFWKNYDRLNSGT